MRISYYLGKPEDEVTFVDPSPGSLQARELDIRVLAYDLWMQDGYPVSDGVQYWLEAEKWWENEWNQMNLGTPFWAKD
jgi:hypothetical protein